MTNRALRYDTRSKDDDGDASNNDDDGVYTATMKSLPDASGTRAAARLGSWRVSCRETLL